MSYSETLSKFGKKEFVPDGWYWLLKSKDVKLGKAIPATFLNEELVIYRGDDLAVRAFHAYCPHMGAHLCDGSVEGNSLRCPFHLWKFESDGRCSEIPVQTTVGSVPKLKSFHLKESYGLIWFWKGQGLPTADIPTIPDFLDTKADSSLGKPFVKSCHPNVMMINAIDAHHFKSVHKLVVDLKMEPKVLSSQCIQFSNTTPLPTSHFLLRFAKRFYKKALTYELTYWWGHTGAVKLGPDFLHFFIIFSLRPNLEGQSEGQTILLTKRRLGIIGWFTNRVLLALTKVVGNYFARGDTIIFSRIRFSFQTPVKADLPILKFIEHYENLSSSEVSNQNQTKRSGHEHYFGTNPF